MPDGSSHPIWLIQYLNNSDLWRDSVKNQSKNKSSAGKKIIKKVSKNIQMDKLKSSSNLLKNDLKKFGRDIAKAAGDTVALVRKKAMSSIHRVEQRLK